MGLDRLLRHVMHNEDVLFRYLGRKDPCEYGLIVGNE